MENSATDSPQLGDDGPRLAASRILLVDDHPTFRKGLAMVIADHADMVVCGEANDPRQALDAMRRLKPDLAMVDISLPGMSGIELIKSMLAEEPRQALLVVSAHDENDFALRALRAGARGYIMKAADPEEIIAAIRKIRRGEFYVSPRLRDRLIFLAIQSIEEGKGSVVDRFSDRELEVFQLLGQGFGTREIAETLQLSTKTVETHRAHLKEKLGFKGGGEVVRFAINWMTKEAEEERHPSAFRHGNGDDCLAHSTERKRPLIRASKLP